MKWYRAIRDPLVFLYLVLVVLLAAGTVKVVADYGTKIEARGTEAQQRLRQIATERQESIEQEQREAVMVAQIALRWQVRAVQLEHFIERQGLSVPKSTVPLRDVPPVVQPEPSEPGPGPAPVPSLDVPTPVPEQSTLEPPPITPPPTPEPETTCIPLPTLPDFCFVPPTPPNP